MSPPAHPPHPPHPTQFTDGAAFAALFLTSAVLFIRLPLRRYQQIASGIGVASLSAGCASSLVGFGLAWHTRNGESTPLQQRSTLIVTLCSGCLSLAVALYGTLTHVLRGPSARGTPAPGSDEEAAALLVQDADGGLRSDAPPSRWQTFTAVLSNVRHGPFAAWLAVYTATRGVHTWVITLWSSLAAERAGDAAGLRPEAWVGLVGALIYLFALPVVALLPRLPPGTHVPAAALMILAMAGTLCLAAGLQALAPFATALCAYNMAAEGVLALSSAQLAASIRARKDDPLYEAHYLGGMLLRYVLAVLVGSFLRLVIMHTWMTVPNVFGLHLSLQEQFNALGLACLPVLAAPLALWLRRARA